MPNASAVRSHLGSEPPAAFSVLASAEVDSMANAETRKYKHITWRKTRYQSGWVVQLRGKTIGSFHSSQEAAAATLRRARGLKRMSQLEEAGTMRASTQRSMFSGVSYHKVIRKFVVNDVLGMGTYTTAQQATWARASGEKEACGTRDDTSGEVIAEGVPAEAWQVEALRRLAFSVQACQDVQGSQQSRPLKSLASN